MTDIGDASGNTSGFAVSTGKVHEFEQKSIIVPIILVPGIMASRLENDKGEVVWDPDSNSNMFFKHFASSHKTQRDNMGLNGNHDPEFLRVNNDVEEVVEDIGPGENGRYWELSEEEVRQRGWGGIAWSFYKSMIEKIHHARLNCGVHIPVYCFGYNWTTTNWRSAEKLKVMVGSVIDSFKREESQCDGVILVTHSMGGMVARAACVLENAPQGSNEIIAAIADKVLGVIHIAQPVLGAPAAYRRMKAGFEGGTNIFKSLDFIFAGIVGRNGERFSSVVCHMPGALELLPTHHYRQWFNIYKPNPDDSPVNADIDLSNPYNTLYLSRKYYRAYTPPAVSMRGVVGEESADEVAYHANIQQLVEKFHLHLQLQRHPKTFAIYSTGHPTVVRVVFHGKWKWVSERSDENRGEYKYEYGNIRSSGVYERDRPANEGDIDPILAGNRLVEETEYFREYKLQRANQPMRYGGEFSEPLWHNGHNEWTVGMRHFLAVESDIDRDRDREGDGTVPVVSARGLGDDIEYVVVENDGSGGESGHSVICNNQHVIDAALSFIERVLVESYSSCVDNMIRLNDSHD